MKHKCEILSISDSFESFGNSPGLSLLFHHFGPDWHWWTCVSEHLPHLLPTTYRPSIPSMATVFRMVKIWEYLETFYSVRFHSFAYSVAKLSSRSKSEGFTILFACLSWESWGKWSNSLFTFLIKTFYISNFLTEKKKQTRKHCVEGSFEKTQSMCDCLSRKG